MGMLSKAGGQVIVQLSCVIAESIDTVSWATWSDPILKDGYGYIWIHDVLAWER